MVKNCPVASDGRGMWSSASTGFKALGDWFLNLSTTDPLEKFQHH